MECRCPLCCADGRPNNLQFDLGDRDRPVTVELFRTTSSFNRSGKEVKKLNLVAVPMTVGELEELLYDAKPRYLAHDGRQLWLGKHIALTRTNQPVASADDPPRFLQERGREREQRCPVAVLGRDGAHPQPADRGGLVPHAN
jgi:hypothetical protein